MCRNHHTWLHSHYRQLDTQEQKCAPSSLRSSTLQRHIRYNMIQGLCTSSKLAARTQHILLPIILKLNSSPPIVPTPVLCSVLKYFKMKCGGSRGTRQMRCTNCKMLIEKTNREALTPKLVNFMDTVYLYKNTCRCSGHFEPPKNMLHLYTYTEIPPFYKLKLTVVF